MDPAKWVVQLVYNNLDNKTLTSVDVEKIF